MENREQQPCGQLKFPRGVAAMANATHGNYFPTLQGVQYVISFVQQAS